MQKFAATAEEGQIKHLGYFGRSDFEFNCVIDPVDFAYFGVNFWVLSEWRFAIPARQRVDVSLRHQGDALLRYIGFPDWILFGGFLGISFGLFRKLRFIFMWGVIFLLGLTGLCLYMSFGLFRHGLYILVWGLTFVDFGYSLLWSVSVFPRRRMDISVCHRDDALLRDADYPFTV